jgi:hypothetical protein
VAKTKLFGAFAALVLSTALLFAQESNAPGNKPRTNQDVPGQSLTTTPEATISKERLPAGSRVFIAPMVGGFDTYLVAGIEKKKVPLIVVGDKSKADFEISGISESEKAGWAKMFFLGSAQSAEQASIEVTSLQSGAIVFAYSVNKGNSVRGKQSAGEACAKHIKEKIESK